MSLKSHIVTVGQILVTVGQIRQNHRYRIKILKVHGNGLAEFVVLASFKGDIQHVGRQFLIESKEIPCWYDQIVQNPRPNSSWRRL